MMAKRFFSDRRGSVLPIFGLSITLIFGMVAVAIDYSRAAATRTDLQAKLDSIALMLSREAIGLSQTQIQAKADAYIAAMLNRPEAAGLTIQPQFVMDGNALRVSVTGSATVQTTLTRILGISSMQIGSTSVVDWEMRRLELVLALDNTGSMQSLNKMTELKKAVKSLLKTLKDTTKTPGQIRAAIVPFDTVVNAGASNVNAPWLTLDPSVTAATWTGCIQDRDQPYDTQPTLPNSAATRFTGSACTGGSNLTQMLPLTNDWTALEQTVDAMTPNGTTNVTIGVAWGMQALTPGSPLPGASSPRSDLDKVMIVLTDGDNTRNRWTGSPGLIDARTSAACTEAKSAGVRIFTIRVIEGNVDLLRGCASNTSSYFDVQNASQLNAVFSEIGRSLANIRISK